MSTVFSVSQVNAYIGNRLENDPNLNNISVRGEISNCSYSSAGHIYFSVKDETSQLSCALFRNRQSGLSFRLKDGQSVVVTGTVNVYTPKGTYSLIAEKIEQEGTGLLYERYEKLKKKLADEGLFDEAHKKPIPRFIKTLGVVTSATGAVLHDIMNVTGRRNPHVNIILSPAAVQGTGAATTLTKGIKRLEKTGCDVIIIGRGGGSFEDLFEFNDETLARTIYDCPIPVISAVGHEVDYTICDFVSDMRAPTPSAAAELAVFDYEAFRGMLVDYHSSLYSAFVSSIERSKNLLEKKALKLESLSPKAKLESRRQKLEADRKRIDALFEKILTGRKNSLKLYAQRLEGLSPLKKLQSGYAYVTDENERNIKSIEQVLPNDRINIRVTDGVIRAVVE